MHGARHAGRQARGGGRPRCKQRAGQGSTPDRGQGTGTALVLVRDVRRVERTRNTRYIFVTEHRVHIRDTANMPLMLVTPEVSHLEMSALKLPRSLKR